jgi:CxxC motif-containing protein (DUF1111 family)
MKVRLLLIASFLILMACKKNKSDAIVEDPKASNYEQDEELSAGIRTVNDASGLAFSFQLSGLSAQEKLDFFVGNSFFNQNWVEAPSSTSARDGLGPMFNARSCASCHFRDGRGEPLSNKGLLFRLSITGTGINGEPLPDNNYGGQLNDNAIQNVAEEGDFSVTYNEQNYSFSDGETYAIYIYQSKLWCVQSGAKVLTKDWATNDRIGAYRSHF